MMNKVLLMGKVQIVEYLGYDLDILIYVDVVFGLVLV